MEAKGSLTFAEPFLDFRFSPLLFAPAGPGFLRVNLSLLWRVCLLLAAREEETENEEEKEEKREGEGEGKAGIFLGS